MRMWRVAAAAVLLVVGVVWIGQGTGTIGGSAMSGQSVWALVGGVAVVGGLIIVVRELARGSAGLR